jgi:hypothetical protein
MQPVVLPHVTWIDNNNEEPQFISWRDPNIGALNIDTRLGYGAYEPSNDIMIASNRGNTQYSPGELIRNDVRRAALKHLELFFYLDNIIEGYNDNLILAFQIAPPGDPSYTTVDITIPPGVYSLELLASTIEDLIDQFFVDLPWGTVPIPVATVTAHTSGISGEGLLGFLSIIIDSGIIALNLVSVDPDCSFIINSTSMLVLSASNTYPNPSTETVRINFFSLCPYNYIDIISGVLSNNNKNPSSTNTLSNYNSIHRIYSPQYGYNKYDYTQPLRWININKDETIYQIDMRFVDNNGSLIRGAVTRNFWSLQEWLLEK